jgi:hypothetical protein
MTTASTNAPSQKQRELAPSLRSHAWLQQQFQEIWDTHFADVERLNIVTITWGGTARQRLGSITGKGGSFDSPERSEIRINALLRDERIPQSVVWQTIGHEMAHYTHGFCSPHPKKFAHPHRGNVIEKELVARNMTAVYKESEAWLKQNWHTHVSSTIGLKPKKRRTYGSKSVSLLSHIRKAITG